MKVVVHGDADGFCQERGWEIVGRYRDRLDQYDWRCGTLVTAQPMSKKKFYYQKYLLYKRGYTLLSTQYHDNEMSDFVEYLAEREREKKKKKSGGRAPYGYKWENGVLLIDPATIVTARRIVALRDAGKTYKQIQDDPEVCYENGRRMSISTIQVILSNRSKYEEVVENV